MKIIGPHVHTTGGVQNAPLNARAVNASGFGLFTKNQRRWEAKPLEKQKIDAFYKNMEKCGYQAHQVLPHCGYLINIGQPDKLIRQKSLGALLDEVNRCELLGLPWLNIHPGSHLGLVSESECLAIIAESINFVLSKTRKVGIVLETTAGQGTNVGYRFEHFAEIIDKIEDRSRIGVCIDTCHIFAAGYDIREKSAFDSVMNNLTATIGKEYIRGAHLNDSKTKLGSRVDRHDNIGRGLLGLEPFRFIMNHQYFEEVPLILETTDETLWPDEIVMLYGLQQEASE
ncbi:Endonuclease IV [Chitinispirillum alkaliphilum]|nr:Endonuclease IV [Chitinispirillum alkaliphilum]